LKGQKQSSYGMGVPIDDEYLITLNYADDHVVIAQDG
jgi:hypothetical protein